MTSARDLLAQARAQGVDRLDAQLLLAHALQRPRAWLLAHDDDALADDDVARAAALLQRRAGGEPLAYLVGEREFHGLSLAVAPGVLVPRPDTETLVDWAIALLTGDGALAHVPAPRVVDLGTGSGAIALAVKHAVPRARVLAVDASPAALGTAAGNAARLGLDVAFAAGSWWQAVDDAGGGDPFHLALSNPPYIAPGDPHLAALVHEPREALVAADDGLADLAALAAGAPARLAPGGWLVMEHGWTQAGAVAGLLRQAGFTQVASRPDLAGHDRCTGGRLPA